MDKQHIVRDSNGQIDLNASVSAFTQQLRDIMNGEVSQEQIDAALDEVFDANSTQTYLPKGALVSATVALLDVPLAQHGAVSLRVSKYLAQKDGRFSSKKGANGGLMRMAREVPMQTKTA